jgi:hypothetical protein
MEFVGYGIFCRSKAVQPVPIDPQAIDRSQQESYDAALCVIANQENGGVTVVSAEQFYEYQNGRAELNAIEGHKYYLLPDGSIRAIYCHSVPIRVRHPRAAGKYTVAIIRDPELLRIPLGNMFQQSPMSFLIEPTYKEADLSRSDYAMSMTKTVMSGILAEQKLRKLFPPRTVKEQAE